jgi:glycosyltransferase involved in cell wall biosynthesis
VEKISLLIPCRNEQGTIRTAIELGKRLPGVNEIIVIEGNSSDDTFQTALNASNEFKDLVNLDIKVIKQSRIGKWNAIQEGIPFAKNASVAIWDADLTVSFSEQCLIHERFLANYEHLGEFCLSTGNRMALREAGSMRVLNLLGNSLFSKLWSLMSGIYIPDLLCGSKVFSKKILGCLPSTLTEKDPYGDFTIVASAIVSGQKIEFQNLTYRARSYGQTNILRWSGGLSLLDFTLSFFLKYKSIIKSKRN